MKILLIFLMPVLVFAITLEQLKKLYNAGDYQKVCRSASTVFHTYRQNEAFVTMYGFACLYSDYIDRLALPVAYLKQSPSARQNAAYFATILTQKKLLYHAMVDNITINNLLFPHTDHPISIVFEQYNALPQKNQKTYRFTSPEDANLSYTLFLKNDATITKMIIDEYNASKLVKRHTYW